MVPTSEAYLWILSKPELLHLWNATEWSLPNCIIEPYSVPEYGDLTGTYYERPDYVGSVINRAGTADGKQFSVSIVIGKSALLADIAHEVAHLYIHSKLGYPLIWLSPELWPNSEQLTTYQHATHFYVGAVHPVIDEFLKDIKLFNPIIYSRILNDYKQELAQYLKNPNSLDKTYFLARTVATKHRLPDDYWRKIQTEFENRNNFLRLMNIIDELPTYPEELNPENIYEHVQAMWNALGLNAAETEFTLSFETPLVNRPVSSNLLGAL